MLKNLYLRELILTDIEKIRIWRNNQINILRQKKKITKVQQIKYFKLQYFPNLNKKKPNQLLYTLIDNGDAVGYGGIVYIDWKAKEGEVSFVLDPKKNYHKKKYFNFFIKEIKKIAKSSLFLKEIITETYSFRRAHIKLITENGFREVRRTKNTVKVKKIYYDSIFHQVKLSK